MVRLRISVVRPGSGASSISDSDRWRSAIRDRAGRTEERESVRESGRRVHVCFRGARGLKRDDPTFR